MSTRFGDINRGAELNTALQNYNAYKVKKEGTFRTDGTGDYKARETTLVDVTPFYKSLTTDGKANLVFKVGQATGAGVAANWALAAVDNYQKAVGAITPEASRVSGYRPARAIARSKAATPPSKEQSKFTKLYYRKYAVTTYSMPFGRADTKSEYDTRKEIVGLLETELKTAGRSLSFSEEFDPG